MRKISIFIVLLLISIVINCEKEVTIVNPELTVLETKPVITDIDGNEYQTVKIGNQWWMAENLKVTHYRNGDAIPNVTGATEWISQSTGAYCNHGNNADHVPAYGRLYNWYAVNDSRNIAPEGWHVPTDEEWKELEMFLGMNQAEADNNYYNRGTDEGGKLKETGTVRWDSPNTGATNESGFTALPGGIRGTYGYFYRMHQSTTFWSSTSDDHLWSWYRTLNYNTSGIGRSSSWKVNGHSIRCVKD
jgi:uncharacterized protein (TIGR02145 family)